MSSSTHQFNLRAPTFFSIINPLTKIWAKNLEANSSTNFTLNYQNTLDTLNYLSDNINNNITINNTIFSDDPSPSTSPNLSYCSFGDVGCSLLTITSTFHVIYIFYVLYKSLSLWRHQFKQNRQIFFTIDPEQNRMRNILAYGVKIFLQVLGGLEALIMSILVIVFHRNGGMVIFVICALNSICCFCSAAFIYLDAITFKYTLRRTFLLILINCFQNGFIFAILLFCNAREHIDAYCFICASVYIVTQISSAAYTIIRTHDFIEVNLENFEQAQNQNTASLINASQDYPNYTNSEQNMYQQQTTLDYVQQYRSQNNSNLQNHQNSSQNYNNPQIAAHKQSKLEEENSSKSNNKNNYKQTGFSSRISTLSNAQNTQNNNNNNNNNNNSSSINIINTGSSNNLVKKSSMTPKTPGMITNTLEDSFSSINHCENLSDDDNSYENNPNASNNNHAKHKIQKKIDQMNRIQMNTRSKSSIQCIGRKDFSSNDDSLDRIEEEDGKYDQKKQQSQIQGLFIGDKWSGSVDFTDNNQQNSSGSNQTANKSNIISNLKQYQIQMNNNYQQSFQRQPTALTDTLQSSVDLMSSNQFITPSFTNHHAQLESHTNSSCNRDSLYLSQQITTPSFSQNFQQYSNNNPNHSSAQSSSNSSLKKVSTSIFSQPQQQNDYHQQQNVNTTNLKRNSNQNCYDNNNMQGASLNSASPSLAANSGETAAFQLNSAGDNSDLSSKQDSSQTSDSYLMNGGQNSQNKMMKQKNQQQGKQHLNAQLEQQDKKTANNQFTKQKSLNMATSPQNSSLRSSPQSTDLINKSQDKQHVLNQMNDLLFCKKQTTQQPNIQPQQVNQPSPQSSSSQQNRKITKTGSSDDYKKMVNLTENTNKKQQDNSNHNYGQQLYTKKGNESSKSQDNLYKLDSQNENLGYYQERYSDLKVVSFEQSEKFDKRTVVFNISFFDSKGESMIIQRSYREFNDLHKYLSSKYKQFKFAPFPKKQNKAQLSSQELVDRTNQFNFYLQSVVNLIKEEVNVINHFLSKETNCFSSHAVLNQAGQSNFNEKSSKSFGQSSTQNFANNSKQQSNINKLNTLPCKPKSVPETIFEDANDCSNVLTDSNASKIDNQDEYNTRNYYNYSRNKTSDQYQLSKNNLNNVDKIDPYSSKNISSSSSTTGKQFGKQ
ncbi:hypothetical protein ABPG74_007790 [Tetrahymena malaccensis]